MKGERAVGKVPRSGEVYTLAFLKVCSSARPARRGPEAAPVPARPADARRHEFSSDLQNRTQSGPGRVTPTRAGENRAAHTDDFNSSDHVFR